MTNNEKFEVFDIYDIIKNAGFGARVVWPSYTKRAKEIMDC